LWSSLARTILAGGLLLAFNGALWCLIGGWIARHELACRWRAAGTDDEPLQPGPTVFVVRSSKTLVKCYPSALMFVLVGLLLLLVAGWVNSWFGGLGSILVALFLPVVLLGTAIVLLYGLGIVAWPLMAVAVAADGDDGFTAQARVHSYFLQRSLHFLLLSVVALGLAGLPGAAVYVLSGPLTAGHPEGRPIACLLAAALSASVFWSLETLIYLHLRMSLDGVDAGEVATGPRPGEATTGASRSAGGRGRQRVLPRAWGAGWGIVHFLAYLAGSWCLISYLLMRVGGGPTDWLDWGLLPWSVAPAQDLGAAYLLARILAGLYGLGLVVWVGVIDVRHALSGAPSETPADPAIIDLFGQLSRGEAPPPDACPRLVECLGHPNFVVRSQAHRYLVQLVPAGKAFGYRAWGPAKKRDAAIAKWRELVPAGPAAESADEATD
jgi:hypothetical protein